MKLKENKDAKSFEFIRKHKTGFAVFAGILIIIISVSIAIYSDTPAKTSGSQNAYYTPDTNRNPAHSKPQTGSESKTSVTETDKEPVKSNLEADTWYVYKPLDLLKFQNCVIHSATSGSKSIMVQYYSVCKKCHIIEQNGEGLPHGAAPGPNLPIKKMYHCRNCGETSVVRLEIIQ